MLATFEIMERIFPMLSCPDQVCFALSCKTTFSCFLKFLALQQKTIQDMLPREHRTFLNFTYTPQPRTQLVRRLQNARWKFCPQCLTLHQYSSLRAFKSKWLLVLHLQPSSLITPRCSPRRCDQLYAGIVDVFPGLSITVRDKLDLINALKIGARDDFREIEGRSVRSKESLRCGPQQKVLVSMSVISHNNLKGGCEKVPTLTTNNLADRFTAYLARNAWKHHIQCAGDRGCTCATLTYDYFSDKSPIADVKIRSTFWLNKSDQSLRVFTDFRFDFAKANPAILQDLWKTHGKLCFHTNPRKWLEEFFHKSGQDFFAGSMNYGDCSSNQNITWLEISKTMASITLNRNLGNRHWPNKNWIRNRHL